MLHLILACAGFYIFRSQGTVKKVSSVGKLTICSRNIKRDVKQLLEKLVYFGVTIEHMFEKNCASFLKICPVPLPEQ